MGMWVELGQYRVELKAVSHLFENGNTNPTDAWQPAATTKGKGASDLKVQSLEL